MNPLERKEVREVDRIEWKEGFSSVTLMDRGEALPMIGKRTGIRVAKGITKSYLNLPEIHALVSLHVKRSTKIVDQAIQNMMHPIDLSGE